MITTSTTVRCLAGGGQRLFVVATITRRVLLLLLSELLLLLLMLLTVGIAATSATAGLLLSGDRVQHAQFASFVFFLRLLTAQCNLRLLSCKNVSSDQQSGALWCFRIETCFYLGGHNTLSFGNQRTFSTHAIAPAAIPFVSFQRAYLLLRANMRLRER